MDVLWDTSGWLTPGEVHEVLSTRREIAYTTAMTVLTNLWEKGVLERRRDGRAYAYHPLQTREERTASTMASALRAVDNRPVVLTAFARARFSWRRDFIRATSPALTASWSSVTFDISSPPRAASPPVRTLCTKSPHIKLADFVDNRPIAVAELGARIGAHADSLYRRLANASVPSAARAD